MQIKDNLVKTMSLIFKHTATLLVELEMRALHDTLMILKSL